MKWFKCLIAGENFPGQLIHESKEIGFYAIRFVQSTSASEAELLALSNLKNEPSLKLPAGVSPSKNAKIYFENIVEVNANEIPEKQTGFTFFIMGT